MEYPGARSHYKRSSKGSAGFIPVQGRLRGPFRIEKAGLHALRPTFPVLPALRHDGGTEAGTEVFGKFVKLGVAIDLDGLLRRVANHIAVVAPGKMIL
jgi:hypothetical protein